MTWHQLMTKILEDFVDREIKQRRKTHSEHHQPEAGTKDKEMHGPGRDRPDWQGEGRLPGAFEQFVAEFVGRNNIFEGNVAGISGAVTTVDTPVGSFDVPTPSSGDLTDGDPLNFVIAADLVQISVDRPNADNVIECELISEQFVGSTVTLFLEAKGGFEIKVQIGRRELESIDLKSTSRLFASWPTARAHVLQS